MKEKKKQQQTNIRKLCIVQRFVSYMAGVIETNSNTEKIDSLMLDFDGFYCDLIFPEFSNTNCISSHIILPHFAQLVRCNQFLKLSSSFVFWMNLDGRLFKFSHILWNDWHFWCDISAIAN